MTTTSIDGSAAASAIARATAAARAELVAAAASVDRTTFTGLIRLCASLTDLTSLNSNDGEADVAALCEKALDLSGECQVEASGASRARPGLGYSAAVCVHSPLVEVACRILDAKCAGQRPLVATVVNFPDGALDVDRAARETREAISRGADEIDVVWPYNHFLENFSTTKRTSAREQCKRLVSECKRACIESSREAGRKVSLKVILESGRLSVAPGAVADSTAAAVEAGADFVKTSTGKVPVGATLEDAYEILTAIKTTAAPHTGFKASGGIRTAEQALAYIHLARELMGGDFVRPEKFRFGASVGFWDNLRKTLDFKGANDAPTAVNAEY